MSERIGDAVLWSGDCRDAMRQMAADGVLFDACVTDPPYHLTNNTGTRSPYPGQYTPIGNPKSPRGGFMGKTWDGGDVAFQPETWRLVLDVLKPGAHLLAFGGTRGYHRLAAAIEDAGFEVRDAIMWHYGSGFPKSLDVSKQLDKAAGAERAVVGLSQNSRPAQNKGARGFDAGLGGKPLGGIHLTEPATDAAKRWQGWGTALKPATEIICVARKPLSERTVAANVLRHGTGALNIDASRVATSDSLGGGGEKAETSGKFTNEGWRRPWMDDPEASEAFAAKVRGNVAKAEALGRWPANVILDDSEEVASAFAAFGEKKSPAPYIRHGGSASKSDEIYGKYDNRDGGINASFGDTGTAARFFYTAASDPPPRGKRPAPGIPGSPKGDPIPNGPTYGDEGSPARFFQTCETGEAVMNSRFHYTSKAGTEDRCGSRHPTVKPLSLLRYLIRLITPPGGTVLDPFAGSGTTLQAAWELGMRPTGCEAEAEYQADIRRRMEACQVQRDIFLHGVA